LNERTTSGLGMGGLLPVTMKYALADANGQVHGLGRMTYRISNVSPKESTIPRYNDVPMSLSTTLDLLILIPLLES
jgi:hypothetical protein